MISSQVRKYALGILAQQKDFLSKVDAHVYAQSCPTLSSSIGQHIRHAVDHFRALLGDGNSNERRVVDYDSRDRGTAVESDPAIALRVVTECEESIQSLPVNDFDVEVEFMMNSDGERGSFQSSMSRELAFVAHHAIHHHAMIKAIGHLPGNGVWPMSDNESACRT